MTKDHPYLYTAQPHNRCRCDDCRAEATKRRKQQRYNAIQRKRGAVFPQDLVDAAETAALVKKAKRQRKLSQREIARLTGVGHPTVKRLLAWKEGDPKITLRVASAMAKGLEDDMDRDLLPGTRIDVKKSQQIIRSLCAQGWTQQHQKYIIENNLNQPGGVILHVMRSERKYTVKHIEDRLIWLANAIGDRQGPSKIISVKMQNMGYFPLKHYNLKGDLIVSTLSAEQRAQLKSVQ